MRIVVYEHVSGGGYAEQLIPSSVLSEGFGMVRSVAADLKAAGHEVTVLLDDRISKLNPPMDVDCAVPILYRSEPQKFLNNIAKINDALYVIAPETERTLQSLVKLVEQTGKISLNSESNAIGKVADKTAFYVKLLKVADSPKTLALNMDDGLGKIKQAIKEPLGYPVVLKPADGVSCSGLSKVREEAQLGKAVAKINAESKNKQFIAQQFIDGEAVSVSLLSTGNKAMALTLNKQTMTLSGPEKTSSYDGGTVPFNHPLKQKAFAAAERIVEAIPGLRGYVGVDLILTQDKAFVVDVNPRLTTSYIGLRKVADFNVAEALVNAIVKKELPSAQYTDKVACFSKVETPKPSIEKFQEVAKWESVVSPPFPLNIDRSHSLVLGDGASFEEAQLCLEEAKKRLCNIIT